VLLGFLGNILLTPIGEPAFRVTALSLVAVAAAAGATVVLVQRLTGSTIIGVATGLGLALTPVVWSNATRADPHPVHLAFVALLMLALVRWEQGRRDLRQESSAPDGSTVSPRSVDRRLILAAILFGLAAGNHSLTPAAHPADCPVRAVSRAGDLAPLEVRPRLHRRCVRDGGARVPRAADPRRPPAGAADLRQSRQRGMASGTSPSPSSSGARWVIRSPTLVTSSTSLSSSRRHSSACSRSSSRSPSWRPRGAHRDTPSCPASRS
jgi:hypothetical protein